MQLEPQHRYTASAEHYDSHRPSYPSLIIDWILETTVKAPPARIADVGCGTGIATRLLAERGFDVVGVDPSEEMLAFARRGGLARYVRGTSTATTLETGSVDLVTAAQCFHWFELEPTFAEIRRVLRPQGWGAALWNLRGATPLMEDYYGLLQAYSSEYAILQKQEAAPAALRGAAEIDTCRLVELANVQTLDRSGLRGRAYSSSCVSNGVRDKAAFERDLDRLFDRHQRGGRVDFRYRTVALCFTLRV